MQIEVEVKGQRIKRLNSPGSVEDTLNYLTCHFTFDGSEWENTIKTAYFKNRATEKIYSSLIADDGKCTVPWESLTDKGFVEFSAAGERENYRITTGIESFYNSKTVYGGEPSEPPTPSQYDQLIALAEQTKEIAESVREDADAGKFDGEPGKPGDPGKDGVSPSAKVEQTDEGAMVTVTDATGTTTAELKNGKDGNPGQDATDEQVQAAVEAYMEEHPIQGDTEDIIKLAIKNEASGAVPVVIADSAEMGVQDIKMQGWTEQDSYEGKNLLDNLSSEWNIGIGLSWGAEYDTPISVNAEQKYRAHIIINEIKPNTKYSFKNLNKEKIWVDRIIVASDYGNGITNIVLYNNVEDYNHDEYTFTTINDEKVKCVYFQVRTLPLEDGSTVPITEENIKNMKVCFNEGDPTYEPYTGGQPSPNPDYPQEIVSAGKYNEDAQKWEYEVKLTGANLFNPEKLTGGEIVEYNGIQCYKYIDNPTNFAYIDDFAENTQYCFSVMILTSEGNEHKTTDIIIVYTDGTRSLIKISHNQLTNAVSSANKTVAMITGSDSWSVVRYIDLTTTTLGIGTEPLPFQPYKEQTVLLTSDRPLTKWDGLEKRNGQWGWVYKSNMLSVPKAGYIAHDRLVKDRKYFTAVNLVPDSKISSKPREGSQYCNICNLRNPYEYEGNLFWIYRYSENKNGDLRIGLSDTSIDTKELFEQYISDKDIYIWYETAEETFVPLSESEQEQMNALYTYYPTTILDNDQGCDMALTYIADTKAYIDNKISAIQAAIVNTI